MEVHGGTYGPRLQVEMFDREVSPDRTDAARMANRAREAWLA